MTWPVVMVCVQCKDRMRTVKRSLKHLGDPDTSHASESDQLIHTRECLLNIGNHINNVLSSFTDPDKIKEWRRYTPHLNTSCIKKLTPSFYFVD